MTTERLSDDARVSLARAVEKYALALLDQPDCLDYLANRGIVIEPSLDGWDNAFKLGFVDKPALPEHENKQGMLAIPYLVRNGDPVGMKFRRLDGAHPKYTSHGGMGTRLYNVLAFKPNSPIIAITEGELDTIVLSDLVQSVAVPGVNSWHEEWRFCFEGYDTVLVFGDGDDPGRDFARRLSEAVPNARAVHMPNGHDVTSYVIEFGAESLRKRAGL